MRQEAAPNVGESINAVSGLLKKRRGGWGGAVEENEKKRDHHEEPFCSSKRAQFYSHSEYVCPGRCTQPTLRLFPSAALRKNRTLNSRQQNSARMCKA